MWESCKAGDGRLTWNARRGFQVFSIEMLYHYFTFLCGLHPATKKNWYVGLDLKIFNIHLKQKFKHPHSYIFDLRTQLWYKLSSPGTELLQRRRTGIKYQIQITSHLNQGTICKSQVNIISAAVALIHYLIFIILSGVVLSVAECDCLYESQVHNEIQDF